MSFKAWLQAHLSRVSSKPPLAQRRHLPYPRLLGPPPVGIVDHLKRTSLTRTQSPASEDGIDKNSPHTLLDVLPLEVRQQIWETILGGHSFHLKIRQGQLVALRCVSSEPAKYTDKNWEVHPKHKRRERERRRKGRKRDALLPILQSCKQMYVRRLCLKVAHLLHMMEADIAAFLAMANPSIFSMLQTPS
jgi:hypothetical protein